MPTATRAITVPFTYGSLDFTVTYDAPEQQMISVVDHVAGTIAALSFEFIERVNRYIVFEDIPEGEFKRTVTRSETSDNGSLSFELTVSIGHDVSVQLASESIEDLANAVVECMKHTLNPMPSLFAMLAAALMGSGAAAGSGMESPYPGTFFGDPVTGASARLQPEDEPAPMTGQYL